MRGKVIVLVVVIVTLFLLVVALLNHESLRSTAAAPVLEPIASKTEGVANPISRDTRMGLVKASTEPLAIPAQADPLRANEAPSATVAAHEEYVDKRIAELQAVLAERDPGSLPIILSELDNPDRRIRVAALEATIQFDSLEAIPRLAEAALRTDDPAEKAGFQEAIEFLQLPTATEVVERRKALGQAVPSRFSRQEQSGETETPHPALPPRLRKPAPAQANP